MMSVHPPRAPRRMIFRSPTPRHANAWFAPPSCPGEGAVPGDTSACPRIAPAQQCSRVCRCSRRRWTCGVSFIESVRPNRHARPGCTDYRHSETRSWAPRTTTAQFLVSAATPRLRIHDPRGQEANSYLDDGDTSPLCLPRIIDSHSSTSEGVRSPGASAGEGWTTSPWKATRSRYMSFPNQHSHILNDVSQLRSPELLDSWNVVFNIRAELVPIAEMRDCKILGDNEMYGTSRTRHWTFAAAGQPTCKPFSYPSCSALLTSTHRLCPQFSTRRCSRTSSSSTYPAASARLSSSAREWRASSRPLNTSRSGCTRALTSPPRRRPRAHST
jgi:hypothetical protein